MKLFLYILKIIDEAGKEYTKMIDMFGDVIDVYQNERHLDFAAKGCSKGKGIKRIIEFYGLAYEDMAAIGDSWNDIPMLKSVEKFFYILIVLIKQSRMLPNI